MYVSEPSSDTNFDLKSPGFSWRCCKVVLRRDELRLGRGENNDVCSGLAEESVLERSSLLRDSSAFW